jgi:hypothetical protein
MDRFVSLCPSGTHECRCRAAARAVPRWHRSCNFCQADISAMRTDEVISALVRALAGYLRANPQASDTCKGARDWWLGRQGEATLQQVQEALDTLVNLGVVVRVLAADGRVRYRCVDGSPTTLERLTELARDENRDKVKGPT